MIILQKVDLTKDIYYILRRFHIETTIEGIVAISLQLFVL